MLAVWTGLEPATPCVTGRYSNQLNYHTNFFKELTSFSKASAKVGVLFETSKYIGGNFYQNAIFAIKKGIFC